MEIVVAARVLVDAHEPMLEHAGVLVDAGQIVAIGDEAALRAQANDNVHVHDLGDRTLLPGLIDSHVHLGFDGGPMPVARMKSSSDEQLLILMLRSARELLSAGVTTARDLGSRGHLGVVVQEAIATGLAEGPELLVSNQPITTTGGHCWFMGGEADGLDEIRRAVRERHKSGANLVKVMSTGGMMTTGSAPWHAQFEPDEIRTLVDEAGRLDMPVAAHAHGTPGIKNAIDANVTTIEHCTWLTKGGLPGDGYEEELVGRIVDQHIGVCLTLNSRFGTREPERTAGLRRRVERMHAAGVTFIAGTDSGIDYVPHWAYAGGLIAHASCGLSAREVLSAATIDAARHLGVGGRKGTLEAGKDADLIAVEGNPLDDLEVLRPQPWVMRAGRVVDIGNRENWPLEVLRVEKPRLG